MSRASEEAPGCGSEGSEVHAWCWGILDRFPSSLTESAGSPRRQPRSRDLLLLNPLESSLYAIENILCLLTLLSHRRKLIPEHALRDRMVVSQVFSLILWPLCRERMCFLRLCLQIPQGPVLGASNLNPCYHQQWLLLHLSGKEPFSLACGCGWLLTPRLFLSSSSCVSVSVLLLPRFLRTQIILKWIPTVMTSF